MANPPTTPKDPNKEAEASERSTLSDYAGRTLDNRYQLIRVLGRGGMGCVFLARHSVIGRPLAVKLLNVDRMNERREYSRLFREAQMAAAIGHPNITEVLDVGVTPEGHPYLVMEYLDGEDVASILRRQGALSAAAACAIIEPVLLALQAAHTRSIVHRDVKPANIFVVRRKDSAPTVKLIDFGIAKELGGKHLAQLTMPGALLGTPAYMPPEQATGVEDVDTRADIYGVGITLYEMLSNMLPFDGANYNETLYRIVAHDAPPLESPFETLPEKLVQLIDKAMQKDPKNRFQSAAEILEGLKGLDVWSERGEAFESVVQQLRSPQTPVEVDEVTQQSPQSPLIPREPRQLPPDFVETVADGASLRPRDSEQRQRSPWPFRATVGVSLAIPLLFLYWLGQPDPGPVTNASNTAAPGSRSGDGRVTITVVGAPRGAVVSYDGSRVGQNPFVVEATETVMSLRVEKAGYEPFQATLVPTQDTTIRVGMQPAPKPPETQSSATSAPTRDWRKDSTPLSPRKPTAAPSAAAVRESGRGTFYTEKFE